MRFRAALVAFAAAPLTVGALAPDPNAPAPAAGTTTAPDANQVVCKKFPPRVGSRIGDRRVCKTAAEWQMIRDSEQETLDSLRKPCTVVETPGAGSTGCQ